MHAHTARRGACRRLAGRTREADIRAANAVDRLAHAHSHVTLEYEIACVDAQPLVPGHTAASLCAVGLWTDMSVRILQLPSLVQLSKEVLGGGADRTAARLA